jgi:hypothetical protein
MASRGHFDPSLEKNIKRLHWQLMEKHQQYVKVLAGLIRECGEKFVTDDMEFLGDMLMGMTNSAVMEWIMGGRPAGLTKRPS